MEKKEVRYKRYRDKINYIVNHLENLPPHAETPLERSATFYDLHTSIEAAIDLVAMYLKDQGELVDDDYNNLDKLAEFGVTSKLISLLKDANGLRNHLVHRYNSFDEIIALNSILRIKKGLYKWIEIVEGFLHDAGFESDSE